MIPWVLVYEEHYQKFCEKKCRPNDLDTFQQFIKEIGTPSLLFQKPDTHKIASSVFYRQVPYASCVRLRRPEDYVAVVHKVLYPELRQREDKSRRSSSCVIV